MLRKALLSLVTLLLSTAAQATHMSGGEIYWECVGPNQFRIRLLVYRDCAGINVDPTYNLVLTSPCGNRNLTVSTNGGQELSQLCDVELPNSTCNGGTLPGIEQYEYTGTITLPPCDSWHISWTNIYRNNAIVNLTNPGTRQMYIESVLNSADAPCNDSPTFTNSAIPYVCLGYPVSYSYGAVDAEADSLSYGLIGARMINGAAIPYVAPYTPAEPITGLTLDPATGLLNFTLFQAGNWVVVVEVTEYDENGNVIGSMMRDMQFVAYPCSNVPPDAATGLVTNLTGQAVQTGPRALQVCESGNFCFEMVINDANAGNVLEAFSNAAQNLPGATFTYTGINPITARLCWTAQPGTSGFYPLIVNVNDGACPIPAFQTYVYSIEVLTGLAATVDVIDESCAGDGSGSATANVTAGTGPYSYVWSTGSSESMIVAGSGSYTVQITDANGCMSAPLNATIGAGAQPNIADAGDDVAICNGDWPIMLSGSVTNATSGAWSHGSGNFAGSWPNNSYTPTNAEVIAGGIDLVLTTVGNAGCPPGTDTVHIAISNGFHGLQLSHTDALCNGGQTGTATVVPEADGHSYVWNDANAQTTATASGLVAGQYSVLINDAAGCDTTMSVTIASPAPVVVQPLTSTNESCAGSGNGTLTATATGGTAPYTFVWNNGATGPTLTDSAGTYGVVATDANGCPSNSLNGIIQATGSPNGADAGFDMTVCSDNGAIYLNESVTNAPSGAWTGGDGTFNGTYPNIDYTLGNGDIAAGSVTLTLTTVGNTTCPPASDIMVITIPHSFVDVVVDHTDATCNGTATGSAQVSTGNNSLTFLWSPGGATTAAVTGLMAGAYSVQVTDQYWCDTTLNVTIGEPDALVVTGMNSTNETCAGEANGTLTAIAEGGTGPYVYMWSNGSVGASITAGAGTYNVLVTDVNGCAPAIDSGTITATGQPNAADAGLDLVGCMNAYPIPVQGTVTNANGGQWSGGSGTILGTGLNIQYMPTTAEVLAGGVDLTLTTTGNATCPPATDVVHIALSNSFLTAALSTTNALCNGNANGSIAFTPALAGSTYLWNDAQAQTTPNASGLVAGQYSVVVTDQLGCDTTLSATITEPQTLAVAQVTTTNVTCAGGSNGSVALTIQGGTPAYAISWMSGQASANITGLTAGTYIANITDANGCTVQASGTVQQPTPMTVNVVGPDTVCVNAANTFSANVTGGAGGYIYNWGGFGFNQTVQLAFAQSQTIQLTVVDQDGCSGPNTPVSVTVLDLNAAAFDTYGDTTVCIGGVGMVGATLTGYAGSYNVLWSPLGYTGMGPYTVPINADQNLTVTISDACGNTAERLVGLRLDIAPSFTLPPIIAQGCAPLTVQFPDLDLGNVVYQWNLGNGNTSNSPAPHLIYQQGNYTTSLTVTTPIGCTSSSNGGGAIHAYGSPHAAFTTSPSSTNIDAPTIEFDNQSTGTIIAQDWTFGDGGTSTVMDPSYAYSEIGTFEVVLHVEDQNGCTNETVQVVTITPVYDVVIPTAFTPDPNGPGGNGGGGNGGGNWVTGDLSNDVFYPFVRFVKDFRMRIFNRWGELIFESTDLSIGWDGYYRGQISPQDVYVVQTWFRFVDGKTVEKLSDLTLFR
ncbi:MAG: gliding motility-associated C-terminal domain-containing protein [Flavobacteriales bacterium]|nr:gliding motility-associated C-terminal domain-containing protein [Flavobacteriales bacterium]